MTKRYTAADFANAKFAEHPETDALAVQRNTGLCEWTTFDDDGYTGWLTTATMLKVGGWVPVPTKPTLTDSEVGELVPIELPEEYLTGFIDGFEEAGGTIIPDPEPTNTDRLEKLIISAPGNFEGVEAILKRPANVRAWAVYLNDHGVTAPNVKGN